MRSLREAVASVRVDGRHQQLACPAHDDRRASLSVDAGSAGGVVLKCHAGCPTPAVVQAAGLTMADLRAHGSPPRTSVDIVATYPYRDEHGHELYQVLRLAPKSFRQRRADGAGGWLWHLDGMRRVLYRLPEIAGAETVWVVEGEKDADRLAAGGLAATTWAGGATAWRAEYVAQLQASGAPRVIVLPDHDESGRRCARTVVAAATAAGLAARVIELAGLPDKGDVSDWLDAGHTVSDLVALAQSDAVTASVASARAVTGVNWAFLLDNTKTGAKANVANVIKVLQHDPTLGPDVIWYDTFLGCTMTAESPARSWVDEDVTRLTARLQDKDGGICMATIAESVVASAVRYVARQRPRNCVRDSIPAWDDEPRIDRALLTYWGAVATEAQPDTYLCAASRNFFLSLGARILRPGCQVDTMLVLEGLQGGGKSRSLRALGGDYYLLATESMASKDFLQSLIGTLIAEAAELDSMSKAATERVKSVLSSPVDKFRSPYERSVRTHARTCVIVGTTNRSDYLRDETGARRFIPVLCGAIDVAGLERDRGQLLAEAVARVASGARWWDWPAITATVQADRHADDPWDDAVMAYCESFPAVTATDVALLCLKFDIDTLTKTHTNRIGAILRLHGWTRGRATIQRKQVRAFLAPTP